MKRKGKSYTRDELHNLALWARRTERACELIPPIACAIMLVHCILLLFDIRLPYAELTSILLAVTLMLLLSRALGFCRLHRVFILYNCVMIGCIYYHREVGFQDMLHPAHILMLIIGALLLINLFIHKCKQK